MSAPRRFGEKENEESAVRRDLFRRGLRVPDERLVVCVACRREVGLRADGTLRNHLGRSGYSATLPADMICPENGKLPDTEAAERWRVMAQAVERFR